MVKSTLDFTSGNNSWALASYHLLLASCFINLIWTVCSLGYLMAYALIPFILLGRYRLQMRSIYLINNVHALVDVHMWFLGSIWPNHSSISCQMHIICWLKKFLCIWMKPVIMWLGQYWWTMPTLWLMGSVQPIISQKTFSDRNHSKHEIS